MTNRRNWIVVLKDIDDDQYEYGPYTKEAAIKAEARIQRWVDRQPEEKQGELLVSAYPINKWDRTDERNEL